MSDYSTLYKKAIYFLSRREYSVKELSIKLAKYSDDVDSIQSVILKLVEQKFLSEERYIEAYVNSKKSQYGLSKIKFMLNSKVDNALSKLSELGLELSSAEQLDTAVSLIAKKYRYANTAADIDYAKTLRFLYARGFNLDIAKEAYKIHLLGLQD
jgi:regulatory protein